MLWPAALITVVVAQPLAGRPAPEEYLPGPPSFIAALELAPTVLPSGPAGGELDGFAVVTPTVAVHAGDDFAMEIGAPLRLRILDEPPAQRSADVAHLLRKEDWDEQSDLGQLLRSLQIGSDASTVRFHAGAFADYSLGRGELVHRYSNSLSQDYHPAGAALTAFIGPVRSEIFASDVLGARIFAGEGALDLGQLAGGPADHFHVSLEVLHDFAHGGGWTRPMSLAWVDTDAALVQSPKGRLFTFLGGGARATSGAALGASLGLSGEVLFGEARLGGRLEGRGHHGTFRPGMVGFDYELARFSEVGLHQAPLADGPASAGYSVLTEAALELFDPKLLTTMSVETFFPARTDLELASELELLHQHLTMGARVGVTGLQQSPRWFTELEARWRFLPSLYALANGGTAFFPQSGGGLSRGPYAGVGLGVDLQR